jgi:hypothetical protein
MSQPEARYADLCEDFLQRSEVSRDGKGFGSSSLKVNGRIFAMLSSRGEFVVKLPRQRVDALVDSGEGVHYDAGKGRPMKEWLALKADSALDWSALADEALAFVKVG